MHFFALHLSDSPVSHLETIDTCICRRDALVPLGWRHLKELRAGMHRLLSCLSHSPDVDSSTRGLPALRILIPGILPDYPAGVPPVEPAMIARTDHELFYLSSLSRYDGAVRHSNVVSCNVLMAAAESVWIFDCDNNLSSKPVTISLLFSYLEHNTKTTI